jgi:hypothetical protein
VSVMTRSRSAYGPDLDLARAPTFKSALPLGGTTKGKSLVTRQVQEELAPSTLIGCSVQFVSKKLTEGRSSVVAAPNDFVYASGMRRCPRK